MSKSPKVTAKLKPHQERVLRKLENSDGVIVAHRVGAGKTLTSIAAGVRSGAPMEIITPASLTKNYEKEIKKHVKGEVEARISSYEKAVRRKTKEERAAIEPGSFLVLDEAHRLRNPSLTTRTLRPESEQAGKRLLLTGTALYNQPFDIAPLANIAAGETVLPADTMSFRRKFIRETKVSPGLLNRLVGVQPGIRKDLQNATALRDALVGRIDVHSEANPEDFPEQIDERINVPMSGKQKEVYNAVMGAAPWHVRRKIRAGLPPSKQESRMLNAFTTAGRQASLSPKPYVDTMTEEEEELHTPKIQEAARRLHEAKKKDRRFRGVVYSNYIEAGLKPYERALKKKKIKFNTLTGKLNAKQKAQMVDEYNSGKVPVLLVSSSGTEGLDLKGTKMVQVLEPHWNNSKIDQVIGRGVRYQSHAHLPPAERKVHVQRYYSSLPKGFLGMDPGKSTEQWIQDRADEKTELANQMRAVFQQASDIEKEAGHVEDRIAERAPGATYEVAKIRARIPMMNLRKGQTYHVPLKSGKGYVVIGDIGSKHVVKTVLGPNMKPPGERVKVASLATGAGIGALLGGAAGYDSGADYGALKGALLGGTLGAGISQAPKLLKKLTPSAAPKATRSAATGAAGAATSAAGSAPKATRSTARAAAPPPSAPPPAASRAAAPPPSAPPPAASRAAAPPPSAPPPAASRAAAPPPSAYDPSTDEALKQWNARYAANPNYAGFVQNKKFYADPSNPWQQLDHREIQRAFGDRPVGMRRVNGEIHAIPSAHDFRNVVGGIDAKTLEPNDLRKLFDPFEDGAGVGAKMKEIVRPARFSESGELIEKGIAKYAAAPYGQRKRDYAREYAQYHAKPEQVANRSMRNQARRKLGLKKGDPREADHKTPISKGGGNGSANLRAVSRLTNRTKFTDKK
jgi:superfamily II DNA or RNA helicase